MAENKDDAGFERIDGLTPTRHLFQSAVDSPAYRMWRGVTNQGIEVWVYVHAVYPVHEEDIRKLKASLPDHMSVEQDMVRTYTCDCDE